MTKLSEKLLLDANVLIDLQNSELEVLSEVKKHVAEIFVLKDIFDNELPDLTESDCHRVDLAIIEPKEHVSREVDKNFVKLTEEDQLNLFTAVDSGFILVTNDVNLRKACEERQVKVIWGLQLILMLVEKSEYSIDDAKNIGEKIAESNPFITEEIVLDFNEKLENIRHNKN